MKNTREVNNIIINYNDFDKKKLNKIVKQFDEKWKEVALYFKNEVDYKKPVINLFNSRAGYVESTTFSYVKNELTGVYKKAKGEAFILVPTGEKDIEKISNLFVHESVHHVIDKIGKDIPEWLNEGMSLYFSKTFEDLGSFNQLELEQSIDFLRRDLPDTTFGMFARCYYHHLSVDYFHKKYGSHKMMKYIKEDFNTEELFGKSQDELNEEFAEHVIKSFEVKNNAELEIKLT
jgi:hypothetical protein